METWETILLAILAWTIIGAWILGIRRDHGFEAKTLRQLWINAIIHGPFCMFMTALVATSEKWGQE
jgi:hypothetical protein